MAQTIEELIDLGQEAKDKVSELFALIEGATNDEATLAGLDSPSQTADYRLWQIVFAAVSAIVEEYVDAKELEIEDTVMRNVAPNAAWLDTILRAFQEGYTLELDANGRPFYAVIDEDAQIIKRVAILEGIGTYRAKVAGEDGGGNVQALTVPQVNAINEYLDQYILGNPGTAESRETDYLHIQYEIFYPALRLEAEVRAEVEDAINEYLEVLDFGGTLRLSKLEDSIQSVDTGIDFRRLLSRGRTNAGAFEDFDRIYVPEAGYITIDPAFPLSSELTFNPV